MSKENIDAAASDQNEVQDTEMTSPENSQGSQQDNNSEFNDAAVEDSPESALEKLEKAVASEQDKFLGILKNKGLEEVVAAAGDTFDSEMHDAITQITAPNKKMKGKIIDVIEKGFQLGDKIIRHPKVVVGN